MRFLLPDQLGNDKHCRMFHSSGFAIAAGVVSVGAAAGSAAISMSAADRAKRAQGQAAATYKKQQREAVAGLEQGQQQVSKMIQGVQAPQYNLDEETITRTVGKGKKKRTIVERRPSMIGDARKITDYNIQQGQKISDYYQQQLEEFLPGATSQRQRQMQLVNQAMGVLEEGLKGGYGQDVADQTMRSIAEFGGAGFNLATAGKTGGFQAMQGLVPRQFGQLSTDVQYRALTALPIVSNIAATWNNFAKAFTADVQTASPLDVGRLQLGYQTAGAEVGLQKARMTSDMFSNIYNAQSGLASQIYGANKENAAASYAAQQAVGQGVSDIGKATSGALTGMSYASAAQQGLGSGIGGYGSNPYYGGMGSGSGSYDRRLNNPNTQYLDTRTDSYG
jgi:hypothetical protein